jgi:hypothetical protein
MGRWPSWPDGASLHLRCARLGCSGGSSGAHTGSGREDLQPASGGHPIRTSCPSLVKLLQGCLEGPAVGSMTLASDRLESLNGQRCSQQSSFDPGHRFLLAECLP